jgi:NADPH-dependent curcumin reductase CurA
MASQAAVNRRITLAARPAGLPKESDFKLVEAPAPSPGPGQMVVRAIYLSVDPYMRGRMNDVKSYAPPVQLGEVMVGGAVGKVVQSNNPRFQAGDIVEGLFGWQEYAVSDGKGVRKVDPSVAPVSTALGVLGMPGLTAYFGLLEIGRPQPGETVVVSGAAGAVGSTVGQIAKIKGCRTVGIAGSDSKIDFLLKESGFDAAFNYKTTADYYQKLAELCPNGIDVYFDNAGGAITDAVFKKINVKARIVICGQISQYNLEKPEMGPRLLSTILVKQAKVEGFLVFQFADRYKEGIEQLARWLKEGKLKYREEIAHGIENAPRAFIEMLQGKNTGKQLVQVRDRQECLSKAPEGALAG